MTNRRSLPVPDGLDGLRLDAAVARMFGLSRTTAATLVGVCTSLCEVVLRPDQLRHEVMTAG